LCIVASVYSERDWVDVGNFVRKFSSAFTIDDGVRLAIAVGGELDAELIGARIEKIVVKLGLDPERCADIAVSDLDLGEWRATLPQVPLVALDPLNTPVTGVAILEDRSPSGLRRYLLNLESVGVG